VLPNIDDSPSKDRLLAHGLAERPVAEEQLYELVFAPGEAASGSELNLPDQRSPADPTVIVQRR
jgi:hypothetical protein